MDTLGIVGVALIFLEISKMFASNSFSCQTTLGHVS